MDAGSLLKEEQLPEAEIYVHIPFCVKKCAYCDFLSFPAEEQTRTQYINALRHEIAAGSGELRNRKIRSVFFGGGTPSVLSAGQIASILEMLIRCFNIRNDAEITLECNPGTANQDKLKDLHSAGINRLSIGAQCFDDSLLSKIGRIHNVREIEACVENARKAGFSNINLDLISALPGQTPDGWEKTLRAAAGLSPEHLSAYSLILEEGTPLFKNQEQYSFPNEDEEREMYDRTEEVLSGYGYKQYEISNYAKPGKECVHNIGYWTGIPYKGFGLGASSLIDNTRFKNTDQMEEYLACCEKPEEQYKEIQNLTDRDLQSEFMILGLRMTKGISLSEFESRFGRSLDDAYPGVTEKYMALGLLKTENDRLFFTKKGVSVSNSVLCDFI